MCTHVVTHIDINATTIHMLHAHIFLHGYKYVNMDICMHTHAFIYTNTKIDLKHIKYDTKPLSVVELHTAYARYVNSYVHRYVFICRYICT